MLKHPGQNLSMPGTLRGSLVQLQIERYISLTEYVRILNGYL